MTDLIKHNYNGFAISQRPEDGYVNLSEMCKVGNKLIADWLRLKSTTEYLQGLSTSMGIPIDVLVFSHTTGLNEHRGTWGHKLVAIEVASWVNVNFKIWANTHLLELMETVDTLSTLGLAETKLTLKNSLVEVLNNDIVTTSLKLAEIFDRRHADILREVNEKLHSPQTEELANFYKQNFIPSSYIDSQGKQRPMYFLNRKGFSLLALGFTGTKAEIFKVNYINAFEDMYEKLRGYAAATFLGKTLNKQLVYIIKNSITGLSKVGVTNNIERRLSQLECATGCELEVIYCHPIADNSKQTEKLVHERFADFRQRGEWFDLSTDVLLNYLLTLPAIINNKEKEVVKNSDSFQSFLNTGLSLDSKNK